MKTRRDLASLGGVWPEELIWYARAIAELQQRPPADRSSWTYMAATHGIDIQGWINGGIISSSVPMPPDSEQRNVWKQCQHGTWYFPPWHRAYLWWFENVIGQTVASLGGPSDWALPYWNYLDASKPTSRNIPSAFLEPQMPDGSRNPLSRVVRNGVKRLGPAPWIPADIDLDCMREQHYVSPPGGRAFGGGVTDFNHASGPAGALEQNPHNYVHVMLGGPSSNPGWMGDPRYAALDPIFWLHHCNIDRLWAAWMIGGPGRTTYPQQWLAGPSSRRFALPGPDGQIVTVQPGQFLPGQANAPVYDDLTRGTAIRPIGLQNVVKTMETAVSDEAANNAPEAVPVGSSEEGLTVGSGHVTTMIDLGGAPETMLAKADTQPTRLLLSLEHVRGNAPSGVLNIYLAQPDGEKELVDTVVAFGLANATQEEGEHAGNGLTFTIDITGAANKILARPNASLERLEVSVAQPEESDTPIEIGRISIHRQPVG